LTSGGSIAAVALVILTSLALFAAALSQRAGALEAAKKAERFHADRVEAAALMSAGLSGGLDAGEGVRRAERLLASSGVGEPGWRERPAYRRLDAAAQRAFRRGAAELAFVAARAKASADPEGAARLGDLAEDLYGPDEVPHPVRRLAAEFRRHPEPPLPDRRMTDEELYLEAVDFAARGEHAAAAAHARTVTERDPKMSRAWFVLAGAEFALGRHDKAEAAYSTCLALSPESDHARCHRGVARMNWPTSTGRWATSTRRSTAGPTGSMPSSTARWRATHRATRAGRSTTSTAPSGSPPAARNSSSSAAGSSAKSGGRPTPTPTSRPVWRPSRPTRSRGCRAATPAWPTSRRRRWPTSRPP
jgi:tetratricopeptide (TPR) repeat protein